MDWNEKNVSVVSKSTGAHGPEVIQDEALLKDWNRAYLSAFKDRSWDLVWNNKYGWKFFVIYLIMWWIGIIMSFLDYWLTSLLWMDPEYSLSIFSDLADVVLWIWLLWFSFNIAKWLFQKVDDFFHEITWDRFWKYLVWGILYGLAVLWWCILLFVPWIIFAIRFKFFTFAIIDKWLWPVDALKYSWRMTKWRAGEVLWFDCYFILWNLVWMLCLLVGLIWTSAMTNIATARYYRLLSSLYDKDLKSWNNTTKA